MNINTNRITNNVNALKTIQSILLRNNSYISSEQIRETCAKYKISRDLLTRACELNYIKKIDISKYKFILTNVEPIHARKIIEKQNELVRKAIENKKIKNSKESVESLKPITGNKIYKPKKNPKVKSITIPVKEKRKVSILWGLISWSRN